VEASAILRLARWQVCRVVDGYPSHSRGERQRRINYFPSGVKFVSQCGMKYFLSAYRIPILSKVLSLHHPDNSPHFRSSHNFPFTG
jgi:hypothetical protein